MLVMQVYPRPFLNTTGVGSPNGSNVSNLAMNIDLRGPPVKGSTEGHQGNGIGVGYLEPVYGALAWGRRCDTKGAVVVTEEGPFVARERAGEERVIC